MTTPKMVVQKAEINAYKHIRQILTNEIDRHIDNLSHLYKREKKSATEESTLLINILDDDKRNFNRGIIKNED